MKGTVSQSPLDSPGDEDRRSREAGLVRELRLGESRERAREGGREMREEAGECGREEVPGSPGMPSSQARALFPKLSMGLNRAEHFGEPHTGLVVFAQKYCGGRWP